MEGNLRNKGHSSRAESKDCFTVGHKTPKSNGATNGGETYKSPVVHPVSPYDGYDYMKELHKGSQELVHISHLVDPGDFFVQRDSHQDMIKEMLREFREAKCPFVRDISMGKIYLVLTKADKTWQRARVVYAQHDLDIPMYRFLCIDTGATVFVSIEQIRLCPEARLQFPPPLAMHCSLANVEPRYDGWTSEDNSLIWKIINKKPAVMHVRAVRSDRDYNGNEKIECDITSIEDGISLAHSLAFLGRAKLKDPKLQYPKMIGLTKKPKIFVNYSNLKPKEVEEVLITHVDRPSQFYVMKVSLEGAYRQLCEELSGEYSLSLSSGFVYYPIIGQVYVVNTERYLRPVFGERWRRGIVMEILKGQRVRLFLPDTGESVFVRYTAMRHIKPSSCRMNALATECHLSGLTPQYGQWSADAVAFFKKWLTKIPTKPLNAFVETVGSENGSVGVSLYYTTKRGDAVYLNMAMVKNDFASSRGLFKFNANIPETSTKPTMKGLKGDGPKATDEGPIKFEVKILSYHSPSLIYVSLIDQQETLCKIYEDIRCYYNRKKIPGKKEWAVGDRCCIFCRESKKWRRAIILELNNDKAKVVHTDFACVKTVPVAILKELAEQFVNIGDAAIQCHLSGIIPACGEKWPSVTKEYLCELIEANPELYMTKDGAIKNTSVPVELWAKKFIPGGALDPDTTEWWCLNREMIQEGLAIPFRSQEDENTTVQNELDDMISFLNVTRSFKDWRLLEGLPSMSQATTFTAKPDRKLVSINEDIQAEEEEEEQLDEPGSTAVSDGLPAEPLTTKQFIEVPKCPACGCTCYGGGGDGKQGPPPQRRDGGAGNNKIVQI